MLENSVAAGAKPAEISTVSARTRQRRAQHRTVADLGKRSRAGRRAAELMAQFEAALGGDLTATQQLAIERAATLTALTEDAQVRRLAGDRTITLDELVRIDNAARRAVRDLGIKPGAARSTELDLKTYLASLAAADEDGAREAAGESAGAPATSTPAETETLTGEAAALPGEAK